MISMVGDNGFKVMIRGTFLWIFPKSRVVIAGLLMLVLSCLTGVDAAGPEGLSNSVPPCLAEAGEIIEFVTPELRMAYLRLEVVSLNIVDYAERGERTAAEDDWRVEAINITDGHLLISLEKEEDPVTRRVEYLLFCDRPEEDADGGRPRLRPMLATEYAFDMDSGHPLYRRQTGQFSLLCRESGREVEADRQQAVLWALDNPERIICVLVIDKLSDYLWHSQQLDTPPGSYNGILKLLERRMAIYPENICQYVDAAWLWWSKWVTWKNNPERMPDGEKGVEQALRILAKGQAANHDKAEYYFEAAMTMKPLAQFHKPEIFDFVGAFLHKAEALGTEQEMRFRVRVRLSLAHMYRHLEQKALAVDWYHRVLELDGENEVAARYLNQLLTSETEYL